MEEGAATCSTTWVTTYLWEVSLLYMVTCSTTWVTTAVLPVPATAASSASCGALRGGSEGGVSARREREAAHGPARRVSE